MKLLIDGENFRHQIAHIIQDNKLIKNKNDYFGFDLAKFCSEILQIENLEIYYFTTKIKQPKYKIPKGLSQTIENINKQNRKWLAQLTNQEIKIIKAGHLRVRESNKCIHCNKKTLVLQEKGVDVRVATELVLSAHGSKEPIALGSSDGDIIPALEVARKLNREVIYICHDEKINRSVSANVRRTVTFSDKDVLKYYRKTT